MSKMSSTPKSTATSSSGSSSDRKSPRSNQDDKAHVPTIKPELVSVQKDHMTLLLAKCQNQQTQLRAMKNLQLVINDAYSKLTEEKKKSARYQTALISSEARYTDLMRAHLASPSGQTELLMPQYDSLTTKPMSEAVKEEDELGTDDIEEDSADHHQSRDEGYHTASSLRFNSHSTSSTNSLHFSSRSSGYYSTDLSSQESRLKEPKSNSLVCSSAHCFFPILLSICIHQSYHPICNILCIYFIMHLLQNVEEYQAIIKKQMATNFQLQFEIKDLQHLLEAKAEKNIDALTKQITELMSKVFKILLPFISKIIFSILINLSQYIKSSYHFLCI